jgi:DNA-binding IclR family transcriptional regulator
MLCRSKFPDSGKMGTIPVSAAPGDTRSLHRAIGLLRLIGTHARVGWRISDLARESGLELGTVHRLLRGLAEDELVARVPGTQRYTLGPLAFLLGLAAAPQFDVDRHARGLLTRAARALGGTLFVKVRDDADSVCIARCDGASPDPSLLLEVGGRRPLCFTAGGVALLLTLPRVEQRAIERRNAPGIRARGRDRWAGVRRMLERSRQHGFGVNLGDIVPGISAIAVPIPGAPASLSLALAGPVPSATRIATLAQSLRDTAATLGPVFAALRYRAPAARAAARGLSRAASPPAAARSAAGPRP